MYGIVIGGPVLWAVPFPLFRSKQPGAPSRDRRARWGVALECIGYTLLWQGSFWTRSPAPWQTVASIVFFAMAALLSWTAARALGRHLRVDAALDSNHELIRAGPYRFVRHPIYTSMLCVLAGTGLMMAPVYLCIPGLALFLIGTEIRMRVEDALLASRFPEQFLEYRRTVPRLIPGAMLLSSVAGHKHA